MSIRPNRRRKAPRLLIAMRETRRHIGAHARRIGGGEIDLLRRGDEARARAVIVDRLDDPARGGRFAHAKSSDARSAARSAPLIVAGVSIAAASARRSNIWPQRDAGWPLVLRMIAAAYWPRTPDRKSTRLK